jgi:hypothetical protein
MKHRKKPIRVGAQCLGDALAFDRRRLNPSTAKAIHAYRMQANCARESKLTPEPNVNSGLEICSHNTLGLKISSHRNQRKPPGFPPGGGAYGMRVEVIDKLKSRLIGRPDGLPWERL